MPTVYKKSTKAPSFYSTGEHLVYSDAFRTKRVPSDAILVREYKRTIFTCGNLNANGVANTSLKLYVKTESGQKQSILTTKQLKAKQIDNLIQKQQITSSVVNIEEVVKHPLLDLLEEVNPTPYVNGYSLATLVSLYLDITGKCFILVETDKLLGVPNALWILPSQNMQIERKTNSTNLVDYYEYYDENGKGPLQYSPEEIIYFCRPSLVNPYLEGMSCLAACYESNEVCNKFITHEDALLQNKGHPDYILAPKSEEGGFGPDTAKRFERELRSKYGWGRSGGVYVPTEAVEFIPVQIPIKDLATLEIHKVSKVEIANAFDVPYALISESSHNRQQLEAAEYGHGKHALVPRCKYISCTYNDQLVNRYDETGRLFLAYDDPVPENRTELLQETVQLKMNGIITPNEARKKYDLPPLPDGDKLESANVAKDKETAREEKRNQGDDDTSRKDADH